MSGPPLPPRERSVVVDEILVMDAIRAEAKAKAIADKGDDAEAKAYDMPTLPELRMLRLSFKSAFTLKWVDTFVWLDQPPTLNCLQTSTKSTIWLTSLHWWNCDLTTILSRRLRILDTWSICNGWVSVVELALRVWDQTNVNGTRSVLQQH